MIYPPGSAVTLRNLPLAAAMMITLLLGLTPAWAARTYYVSPTGHNGHEGTETHQPWQTIEYGLSNLEPGDTLVLLPGTYRESLMSTLKGTPDEPITIRAQHPGTAHLRGDRDMDAFEKVPGTRYVWVTDIDQDVEGVAERSTLRQYNAVPSAAELDEVPASFHYDPAKGRLYVRTSDGQPPAVHALSVSVTNGFGLLLRHSHDVVIDGLVVSGYNARQRAPLPGAGTRWGIYLLDSERITIRQCTVYFNGGGIGLMRVKDTLVEHNVAFANDSVHHASGGNIIARGRSVNLTYRHNLSHTTGGRGIRFYTGGGENGLMLSNIVFGTTHEALQYKGGDFSTCRIVGNVALGMVQLGTVPIEHVKHNIIAATPFAVDKTNILTRGRFNPAEHFVDPTHHDYRLQSDSSLRGSGPNGVDPGPYPYRDEVFFVSPNGDDQAAGTSIKQAWQTIGHAARQAQPGHTVYILPGIYHESLQPTQSGTAEHPVVFRRHGHGRVVLDGRGKQPAGVVLNDRAWVTVQGLILQNFTQTGITANRSIGVKLTQNQIVQPASRGIDAAGAKDIELTHNLIEQPGDEAVNLTAASGARVSANVLTTAGVPALVMDAAAMQTLWSDHNLFTPGSVTARIDNQYHRTLDDWQQASGMDASSLSTADTDASTSRLLGRGPGASAIGPWPRQLVQRDPIIENVQVHSVTATTVNLEWWTPADKTVTRLRWGKTPAMENVVENVHAGSSFHTVSLIGLEPQTEYHFQVEAVTPIWEIHSDPDLAREEQLKDRQSAQAQPLRFRTLSPADQPQPRQLHVSLAGSDQADGLTPQTAWQTLQHASNQARPGDVIHVAPGRYETFTAVRTTGEAGRPITFRASDQGQVWLEGSGKNRPAAFRLAFKHHIHIEGFYLRDFAQNQYGSNVNTGAIEIIGGSNNLLGGNFFDGRSTGGYVGYFVRAWGSDRLTIDNCVIVQGWNGANFTHCPNLLIQHTVFYNTQIRHMFIFNQPDESVTLRYNLFADNIPTKINNALIGLWHLESLQADHNLYFTRLGEDGRQMVSAVRVDDQIVRREYTLAQLKAIGLEVNSQVANPQIPVVEAMELEPEQWAQVEVHRDGTRLKPLDFPDFLPASPAQAQAVDGRPRGLDPSRR